MTLKGAESATMASSHTVKHAIEAMHSPMTDTAESEEMELQAQERTAEMETEETDKFISLFNFNSSLVLRRESGLLSHPSSYYTL